MSANIHAGHDREPRWAQWTAREVPATPFATVATLSLGRVRVASVGPVWWSVVADGRYCVVRVERLRVDTLEMLPTCTGIQVAVGDTVHRRARTEAMTDPEWLRVVLRWVRRAVEVGGRVDAL